jgi:hypothetical protein
MADEAWLSLFEIKYRQEQGEDHVFGPVIEQHWDVVNRYNGEVVATYRSESYAKKQAKRRYKKFVRLMEKSLMSKS